jgi:hypothetical protein
MYSYYIVRHENGTPFEDMLYDLWKQDIMTES